MRRGRLRRAIAAAATPVQAAAAAEQAGRAGAASEPTEAELLQRARGPDEPGAGPPPALPSETELTWIEVELVDEEGIAVAGARFRVALSDGTKREGQLDEQGRARLEGVPAGPCTVSFLDLGAQS